MGEALKEIHRSYIQDLGWSNNYQLIYKNHFVLRFYDGYFFPVWQFFEKQSQAEKFASELT